MGYEAPALAVDVEARAETVARLRRAARGLRAFDVDTFTLDGGAADEADRALIAAGALIAGCSSLIDHLIADVATLLSTGAATAAEASARGAVLFALDRLPPGYADHYTPAFAKKLLVAAVSMAGRLAEPDWIPLSCLAEQLALHLLIQEAVSLLELVGRDAAAEADPGARYQYFAETALEDSGHLRLYSETPVAVDYAAYPAAAPINAWFTPLYDGFYVHPYVEPRP